MYIYLYIPWRKSLQLLAVTSRIIEFIWQRFKSFKKNFSWLYVTSLRRVCIQDDQKMIVTKTAYKRYYVIIYFITPFLHRFSLRSPCVHVLLYYIYIFLSLYIIIYIGRIRTCVIALFVYFSFDKNTKLFFLYKNYIRIIVRIFSLGNLRVRV